MTVGPLIESCGSKKVIATALHARVKAFERERHRIDVD
jgi:hypothetical protein